MRKFKILFLMLIAVFWVNSCAALATAAAVTYLGGTALVYACAEYPNSFFCNPYQKSLKLQNKRQKERTKKEKNRNKRKLIWKKKKFKKRTIFKV